MTSPATQPSYTIRTLVDGVEQWPAETVTAPVNYELGEDLTRVAEALAAEAVDNTGWHTLPAEVTVLMYADESRTEVLAEGTWRHLDEPVGIVGVARMLHVERATVDQWRQRPKTGFPPPSWPVEETGSPQWRRRTIIEWAKATGRV